MDLENLKIYPGVKQLKEQYSEAVDNVTMAILPLLRSYVFKELEESARKTRYIFIYKTSKIEPPNFIEIHLSSQEVLNEGYKKAFKIVGKELENEGYIIFPMITEEGFKIVID